MKRILLLLIVFFSVANLAMSQTSLEGKVTDAASGEALPFATVGVFKDGALVTGVDTDLDGNYSISDIDPGNYDVEASFVGYTAKRLTGVVVKAGKINRVAFELSDGVLMDAVEITAYKVPLIEVDNTTSGATVTAEKIRSLPTKNINAIAATSAGISSTDGGDINVRGSRSNATVYYVDGIRVSGDQNLIPQSEIDQMQIITGGVEARYGDLVGGAISITSKGPSNKFSGGAEVETSEYLDGYGYNLLTAYASGPILKNSDGNSVLGFRFSGQYRDIDDNSPIAGGVWALTEEKIKELEENPTFQFGQTTLPSLEQVTDAKLYKARPNNGLKDLATTAKIDARFSDAIDVSISGSFNQSEQQFTGGGNNWRFANWTHNPFQNREGYRGNFRFRHKIGRQSIDDKEEGVEQSLSNIRNFTYMIQAGFERNNSKIEDPIHKDNFFNYGYYGAQGRDWVENNGFVDTSIYLGTPDTIFLPNNIELYYGHQGYSEVPGEFTPSETINPVLAKYNSINGFRNDLNDVWSGLFSNVGQVYNRYQKSENDIITFNVSSGFDFLPGGSKQGRHGIQFGFLYEQRVDRLWNLNPRSLWELGNISVNNHLTGIDPNNVIRIDTSQVDFGNGLVYDAIHEVYGANVNEAEGNTFYKKVRKLTGDKIYEYVNIDALDPSQLRLDMFSASELNDQDIIYYYGYDYKGNKLSNSRTFDDFFSSVDENGVRTFESPANKPIYGAAYIQDKFSFRDLIFRVGVRADYYDANTKVLIDPYSLYEVQTAKEFYDISGLAQPEAVSDDYRVYVASEGSQDVIGFRKGDEWFTPDGTSTSGANIFGGGLVYPKLKDPEANIKDLNFDASKSFKDYEPQLNIMPRVAFSFPINDDANFFAHYDVLYQRPSSNTIQSPVQYYYFERAAGDLFNNPDLKPVRTVDYELGYQQKVSNTMAVKLAAYYKEQKDLIQSRVYNFLPAPVNRYESYGNLDFATVQGFTFQLDRRRVSNLELTATYTLQYASGSGSDANSSRGINNRGILRNLNPLSYDERHRITAVIDYRYDGKYNGPKIGDVELFKNAGINFNLAAVSGRPYSKRRVADTRFGGSQFDGAINGSRLPWTFNVDMMLEKGFQLFKTENSRGVRFNAYLRVQNLLDIRNVRSVFPVTGDPEDDGYLVGTFGQDALRQLEEQNRNTEAFLAAYQWRLDSFNNFSLPRRIYLGLRMDF